MRFARSFALFSVLSPLAGLGEFRRDDAFFEPINVCSIEGGGGAGGGGGSNEPPPGNEPPPPPQYVTADELGKAVNAAVSSHMTRLRKDALDPISTQLNGFGETLKKLTTPKEPEPNDQRNKQPDPETLALKNQLEELKQANAREREAREKAETKQRDDAAYSQLRTLVSKTVRPELVDVVAKNLFYADKVVTYDENGKPLFKARRAQYPDGPEEDVALTLEDGVQQFLKSKEAQVFLPAPAAPRPSAQPSARTGTRLDPATRQPLDPKRPLSDKEKIARSIEREREIQAQQRSSQ